MFFNTMSRIHCKLQGFWYGGGDPEVTPSWSAAGAARHYNLRLPTEGLRPGHGLAVVAGARITPMQKQKKSYPSQSPLTNTQPTKTHKPDKHTTKPTKPTSTQHHKSNNSQQQKDWPLLTEHKHSGAWFQSRDFWVMSPTR